MPTIKDRYVLEVDTKGAKSALSGLKSALIAVGAAIVTKEIVDVTARFEDLQTTLKSVTGSAKAGQQAFQFIQNFATKTQFGIEDLTKTFIQLKANGLIPTQRLLTLFTDTAAVTTDQIGALEAMTKLWSRAAAGAGIQVEDLDILAERGIPVYKLLEERIGLVKDEITKFGNTASGTKTILATLEEGLNEAFGGATADRANNLSTILSNFKIAVTNLAYEFGSGLAPMIKEVTAGITKFIEENKTLARTIGETLGRAVLKVKDLVVEMLETMGLLKAGGLEDFSATITAELANFLEGFGKGIDSVVNLLIGVINGLQAAIVGISKITPGFDAVFLEAGESATEFRKKLEDELAQAEETFQKFGYGQAAPALATRVDDIKNKIKELDEGTLLTFKQIEANFSSASTYVTPFVESLRETSAELTAEAQAARDAAAANTELVEVLSAEEQAMIDAAAAAERLKKLNEALTSNVENYLELAKERLQLASDDAELNKLDGIQRRLYEIRKEEEKLRDEQIKRIETMYKGADPAVVAQQIANVRLITKQTIEARQAAAKSVEEHQRSFTYGWRKAMDEYVDNANNAARKVQDAFTKVTQSLEDSIVSFARTGKLEFKSLVADMLETLLRSQIQQVMAKTLNLGMSGGGTFGSSLGNFFSGFFANGGFIPGGTFGIVGERGPELVTGPANVTPIQSSPNVTYNINAVDAMSFRQMVARDPGFIHAVAMKGGSAVPSGR